MGKPSRIKIDSAKQAKRYHCLKLVEGLVRGDEKLAERHLIKMIETRLGNKIKHVVDHDNLI